MTADQGSRKKQIDDAARDLELAISSDNIARPMLMRLLAWLVRQAL